MGSMVTNHVHNSSSGINKVLSFKRRNRWSLLGAIRTLSLDKPLNGVTVIEWILRRLASANFTKGFASSQLFEANGMLLLLLCFFFLFFCFFVFCIWYFRMYLHYLRTRCLHFINLHYLPYIYYNTITLVKLNYSWSIYVIVCMLIVNNGLLLRILPLHSGFTFLELEGLFSSCQEDLSKRNGAGKCAEISQDTARHRTW